MIRGTPPYIFFQIFFDGKIFFVHSTFFSENGVRNKLQTKESRRFFPGGVIMTPPLDLQGLNVQVVSNAQFCVDSKNTTQNVLRHKLTSQPYEAYFGIKL